VRIGWLVLLFAAACKDPGGVPVVESDLGATPATPHFLTDLIALGVDGQDLVRIDAQTGLADVVFQGAVTAWPLPSGEAALVLTTNYDVVRVSLSGTAFPPLLTGDGPEDFADLMADPGGLMVVWTDAAGVLTVHDTTADSDLTYEVDGAPLLATPLVVAPAGNYALVQEAATERLFTVPLDGTAPTPVAVADGMILFDATIGVNGVRLAGRSDDGARVLITDEAGEVFLDEKIVREWTGRAAVDADGLSVLSLEDVECLAKDQDPCDQGVAALIRYAVGQRRERVGESTVVGQSELLDRPVELSPNGERMLLQSQDGLWFVGNPDA
jgi:hypothetical protein